MVAVVVVVVVVVVAVAIAPQRCCEGFLVWEALGEIPWGCGAAEFVFFGGYVKCSDPLKGLDFRVNPKGPNT